MIASVFFLASFIKEQFTPKCLREVRDITRDVVFAIQEARLHDFSRDVKCKKTHLKQNIVSGVNSTPRNSFSRKKNRTKVVFKLSRL